jgi:hypothetical protein
MAVSSELVPGEPIVILTFEWPFEPRPALLESARLTQEALETVGGDVIYRIDDIRKLDFNFSNLVQAMGTAREAIPGSLGDERVHTILVGSGKLVEMITASMKQAQYGGINIAAFSTVEEAVEHARREIKSGKQP